VSFTWEAPSDCSVWITLELIVTRCSTSFGRIGPGKSGLVVITWPKRSSSPGPRRLALGKDAPTCAVCPAADTVCSGATRRASHIAPAVTSVKVST
jgi:hypothetical protein